MNPDNSLQQEPVSSSNCDRLPIYTSGSIQPHGILFVLTEPHLEISQVSQNTEQLLGILPEELLGQPLSTLFTEEQSLLIRNSLQNECGCLEPLKLSIENTNQTFYGIVHRHNWKNPILEIEPFSLAANFHHFPSAQIYNFFLKIKQAETLRKMCGVLAKEIRKIIGFDRVMIYRFNTDGAGTVIAEDKADFLESYLGFRYPDATDLLQPTKPLDTRPCLCLIPQVNYQSVPIISAHPVDPLDLSHSILRSVSPTYLTYLKDIGVGAFLSISLIENQQLWGLMTCHHQTPKFIPSEFCTICEFLCEMTASEITTKEDRENWEEKIRLKLIQSQIVNAISGQQKWVGALEKHQKSLLDLVNASGIAIFTDGHLTTFGETPSKPAIHKLLEWLPDRFQNHLFVTDSLAKFYPPAVEFKAVGSGLLALSITEIQKNYILWFRPEKLQQVQWAGNPHQSVPAAEDDPFTVSPRKAFDFWQETVRLKSLPWQSYEIEGILELRKVLVDLYLHQVEELAATNLELERCNNELDSFAYIASHDLKEPLRGIHNYSRFLLEDYADILDEEGVARLKTLVRLTKRMENLIEALLQFSRLGRQELKLECLDLNEIVAMASDVFRMSQRETHFEIQVPRPLPKVWGDRLLLEEVFANLIGNALKYNDRAKKWIEIGFLDVREEPLDNDSFCSFYVKDNGIGIHEQHLESIFRIFKRLHAIDQYGGGTGVGLTIAKKIIERQGGQIWVESTYGIGSTFYFTLRL